MEKSAAIGGPVPQHCTFSFEEDQVSITSDFDSGNLAKATRNSAYNYSLWTGPDAMGTSYENTCRTWFYFKATAPEASTASFTIKNLNLQGKMFRDGMKPVVKTKGKWQRIATPVSFRVAGEVASMFELTFVHLFEETECWFAFTYPWSCEENDQLVEELSQEASAKGIYFYKELLTHSLDGRKCDVLTISSQAGITSESEEKIGSLFPEAQERAFKFQGKEIVFISSRVHPGETPGSHMMNGFLKFLVSDDPRAAALRDQFVFKVVPILNPDGVFRGHYRTDTKGMNLNRVYNTPSASDHPTIFAVKELIMHYHRKSKEGIYCYIDLHGHASKKGIFVYGNYMDYQRQIETCLFAKLMSLNCINFDFEGSCFQEKNMRAKDKRDGLSKEGSGRVALFKAMNLVRCYTLEANYNSGKIINQINPSPLQEPPEAVNSSEVYSKGIPFYDIEILEDAGRAIGISLLDLCGKNQFSRVLNEDPQLYRTKLQVASYLATQVPFRFDPSIKRAAKSEDDLKSFLENGCKPVKNLKPKKEEVKPPKRPSRAKPREVSTAEKEPRLVRKSSTASEKTRVKSEPRVKEVSAIPVKNYLFPNPDNNKTSKSRGRQRKKPPASKPVSRSLSANKSIEDQIKTQVSKDLELLTVIEAQAE